MTFTLTVQFKWLVAEVSLGEVNNCKPTTQNTCRRDVTDFVHAERNFRKKTLLAG